MRQPQQVPATAIRPVGTEDRPAWDALWRANCQHFQAPPMTPALLDALWDRILDPCFPMRAWLAWEGGVALGLAHVILRPHSFSLRHIGWIEDLWVAPEARGRGLGRALIATLAEVGRAEAWRRLEWETEAANAGARRLYDRIAEPDDHPRYRIDLKT